MKEGRYQAYPEYRDSGVEWLGDSVQSHWKAQWKLFGVQAFSNRDIRGHYSLLCRLDEQLSY